ncbi:MAG TPA: selenocysteine-specific translation elongation factor [Planctomycetaceae bacterium]|nr:selenocysteine-specific translation elongation factor [Planctomycetaceae bacterium]
MAESGDFRHVLIGTAGHIDHGKTRLVGALTGIDTDRLPEEKARGISIDLGFAHWEAGGFQFGVVDVPGHERFVRNMVAGATGVNLALLVVAADDGVMPQTREHLDIMDLLGVRAGVVAVNKVDLVEPDFVELVEAEVQDLVAGTFLEGCPIVPVSAATGAGLDRLRQALVDVARGSEWVQAHDVFRMPIDRVFSIAGHGTVVTGSVLSGEVHAGDTLELLPGQREVRVRSVESHGAGVEDSGARRRTAVNLAGVKQDEVRRGNELATPGSLKPARRLLVAIRTLAGSPVTVKNRMELSLHVATAEVHARLVLKDGAIAPGSRGYAELRTKEPVAAAWGQRFILRRISPQLTVAGGTVLDPALPVGKRVKDPDTVGAALASSSEAERLGALLRSQDAIGDSPLEAAWRVGVPPARYAELIGRLRSQGQVLSLGVRERPLLVHRDRLAALAGSVMRTIRLELERHQPRKALPRTVLLTACRKITRPDLLEAVFEHLVKSGELVEVGGNFGPADAQVQLTKKQQQTRAAMLERIGGAGLAPPTAKELADELRQPPEQLVPLLNLCVEDGLLVRLGDGLYVTPDAVEQARGQCEQLLADTGAATVSQLREAWGVSRKYAVPLSEHFDALGVTRRDGDVRRAGPKLGSRAGTAATLNGDPALQTTDT